MGSQDIPSRIVPGISLWKECRRAGVIMEMDHFLCEIFRAFCLDGFFRALQCCAMVVYIHCFQWLRNLWTRIPCTSQTAISASFQLDCKVLNFSSGGMSRTSVQSTLPSMIMWSDESIFHCQRSCNEETLSMTTEGATSRETLSTRWLGESWASPCQWVQTPSSNFSSMGPKQMLYCWDRCLSSPGSYMK
jgi:hypothetical protein